ncbi:MAG: Ig-like domain-containing protein [bacterium]|nr:Ig-like domain-containing protein [bacterium]
MNTHRFFNILWSPFLIFVALLLLIVSASNKQASAATNVNASVRISDEIDCEADPQTNIYFDITPVEGGEVAIDDNGIIRKFDSAGTYEGEGLSGYFGNGTYQGTLIPKTGFTLAQPSAFSFAVNSQCDANGVPILSPQLTSTTTAETPTMEPPPPEIIESPTLLPDTTETTPTAETTSEPTSEEQSVVATTEIAPTIAPTITSCANEEECAQLCSGTSACADFAVQTVVPVSLSSLSVEVGGTVALQTAVNTFLEERSGVRAYADTDQDGIVDFDEVNVYGTDPKQADSDQDGVLDGAELLANTNPKGAVGETGAVVIFEDPAEHGATASSSFVVSSVVVSATATDANGVERISSMMLVGKAPANSFVTIFIYSEPIVVTIKTDAYGSWTYTLDKELSDGSHEVFAAVTDTEGRVLAKSTPLPFVQTASAITVGSLELLPQSEQAPTFFGRSGLMTMFAFFLAILVVVLFVLGMIGRRKEGDGTGTGTPSAA